jgi:SAM-dependent methyltransferase
MTNKYFYKKYPETCASDDFWGQVKRTVNGKAVTQDQIDLIVNAIKQNLSLKKNDVLLDLCCGNGALSNLLFPFCNKLFGVDYSEFLIKVAKDNFESDYQQYLLQDVSNFVESKNFKSKNINFNDFNKSLCYGAFQYLTEENSNKLLFDLRDNFPNIEKFYIGNLPDLDRVNNYFKDPRDINGDNLKNPDSPIGIWRSINDFKILSNLCGWDVNFFFMPNNYYGAHYRYDALLTKK